MIDNRVWGRVLEEFSLQTDAMPAEDLTTRPLSVSERVESVTYLVEKGFLKYAGTVQRESRTLLYRITEEGLFAINGGLTQLEGRKRRLGEAGSIQPLAYRVLSVTPRSVWDLTAIPWHWSKAKEYLRIWGRIIPSQERRSGFRVRWEHADWWLNPQVFAIDRSPWVTTNPASLLTALGPGGSIASTNEDHDDQ